MINQWTNHEIIMMALFEFYMRVTNGGGNPRAICPFTDNSGGSIARKYRLGHEFDCEDLCRKRFPRMRRYACPCHQYGSAGAMKRLRLLLIKEGYIS